MGLKEIESFVKLARRLGLRSLRVGEVGFELGPEPLAPPKRRRAETPEPESEEPEGIDDPLFDAVKE